MYIYSRTSAKMSIEKKEVRCFLLFLNPETKSHSPPSKSKIEATSNHRIPRQSKKKSRNISTLFQNTEDDQTSDSFHARFQIINPSKREMKIKNTFFASRRGQRCKISRRRKDSRRRRTRSPNNRRKRTIDNPSSNENFFQKQNRARSHPPRHLKLSGSRSRMRGDSNAIAISSSRCFSYSCGQAARILHCR